MIRSMAAEMFQSSSDLLAGIVASAFNAVIFLLEPLLWFKSTTLQAIYFLSIATVSLSLNDHSTTFDLYIEQIELVKIFK